MFKKPEINFPELNPAPSKPTGSVILFGEVLIDAFPDRLVLGGAPFNVARHLRAFGLHPTLISRTGNDEYRNIVLAAMAYFGMETLGVQCDPTHPTGKVRVHVGKEGHRFEILPDQAYDFINPTITRMVTLSAQADLVTSARSPSATRCRDAHWGPCCAALRRRACWTSTCASRGTTP